MQVPLAQGQVIVRPEALEIVCPFIADDPAPQ